MKKPSIHSKVVQLVVAGVLCAAATGQALALAAGAAPSALSASQTQKGAEVTTALLKVLHGKVSSPGGTMNFSVKPGARADLGYFDDIAIKGKPAQVKHFRVSELDMHARNVKISVTDLLQKNQINTLGSDTHFRAVITDADLTHALSQGKVTKPMGIVVKYVGGNVVITGNFSWGWIGGPMTGIGKLRLAPGHKVYFDLLSLKLNGTEVPQWLKTKFGQRINPIIDYADIPFKPQFKSLTISGNSAILVA